MKISELVIKLLDQIAEHGDIEVVVPQSEPDLNGDVINHFTEDVGLGIITGKLPNIDYPFNPKSGEFTSIPDVESNEKYLAICSGYAHQWRICDEYDPPED